MGNTRGDARLVNGLDDTNLTSSRASALEENVQAIKRWEKATLLARSKVEQVSDWIACTAASGPVLILHIAWFGAWITMNVGELHNSIRSRFPSSRLLSRSRPSFWRCSSWPARIGLLARLISAAISICKSTCSRSAR